LVLCFNKQIFLRPIAIRPHITALNGSFIPVKRT
jgi:hypothetical protein